MSKNKDCKISLVTLIQRMWKDKAEDNIIDKPLYVVQDILSYIIKKKKQNRFYDLKENKFCFIQTMKVDNSDKDRVFIEGYFKSARSEFRPDLINKRTGEERKNPKEKSEGDIEKTHFVIFINKTDSEVYLFVEFNFHGITINNIISYLSHFNNEFLASQEKARSYSIRYLTVASNNFLTELESLKRTKLAEIYFDKQLLGSEALNFSNRTVSLKKDLKLVASAEPRESITEVGVDFYNKMNQKNSPVSKVRILGVDDQNNEIVLDTSFMGKVEFVNVNLNEETGEVNSTQLLSGMLKLAKSF